MSKSLGNIALVDEVVQRWSGRSSCATTSSPPHYRSMIEFTDEALARPASAYRRIEWFVHRAAERGGAGEPRRAAGRVRRGDGRRPRHAAAIAVVHEAVRQGNTALADGDDGPRRRRSRGAGDARRARPRPARSAAGPAAGATSDLVTVTDGLVALALEQRQAARARKDFAAADAIRDQLSHLGVAVEDTAAGNTMGAEPLMAGNSQRRGRPSAAAQEGRQRRHRRQEPPVAGRPRRRPRPPRRARAPGAAQGPPPPRQRQRADRARARQRGRGGAGAAARPQPGRRGAAGGDPGDRAVRRRRRHDRGGTDERITEAMRLAADRGLPLLEVGKAEFDRMSNGALHQGIGLQVPAVRLRAPRRPARRRPGLRPAAADRGHGRRHRPAQPRRRRPIGRGVRRPRRRGAAAPGGRHDRLRLAHQRRCRRPAAGGPGGQPGPVARLLPGRRPADRVAWPATATSTCTSTTASPTRSRSSSAPRARGCPGWCASAATSSSASRSTGDTESLNVSVAAGIALYQVAAARR